MAFLNIFKPKKKKEYKNEETINRPKKVFLYFFALCCVEAVHFDRLAASSSSSSWLLQMQPPSYFYPPLLSLSPIEKSLRAISGSQPFFFFFVERIFSCELVTSTVVVSYCTCSYAPSSNTTLNFLPIEKRKRMFLDGLGTVPLYNHHLH
jgi:hypothetical protein